MSHFIRSLRDTKKGNKIELKGSFVFERDLYIGDTICGGNFMSYIKNDFAANEKKYPPGMNADRMNSWKEIAHYLGKDIATCNRWEKNYGLPIYRIQPNSRKSPVFSFKREIDEWFESRARKNRNHKKRDEGGNRIS